MKKRQYFVPTPTSLFLTTIFCAVGFASAAEPSWILNNGPDWLRVDVEQGRLETEVGLTRIDSTGSDAKFAIPLSPDETFSAAERPFFALRYKITSTQKIGGLFYTTDRLTTLSDKSYSAFPVESNGEWNNLVLDMRSFGNENWSGTVRSFRLDPTNPSEVGATFSISRLGFFPSVDAANAFLDAADDSPDYASETTFSGSRQRVFIPGGVLSDGYRRDDFLLKSAPTAEEIRSSKTAPEELVVVRVDSDDAETAKKIVPLCETTRLGFTTFSVDQPGTLRLEVSDAAARFADVAGRPSEKDVRFVVARRLMFGTNDQKFLPTRKLTASEGAALLEKLKISGIADDRLAARIKNLDQVPLTREETARLVAKTIRQKLGTDIETKFPPEYFLRDRIRVGAWGNFSAATFDEKAFKTYRDCGFDFLLAISGGSTKEFLNYGNKYGVEIYVDDGGFLKPEETPSEYCDYPSYAGTFVADEPGSDAFDDLAAKCAVYSKATGKTPYVNLLPMYANAAQLKYGAGAAAIEYYDADPDLYRKYCESFCQKFDVHYICTDIYPLYWNGEKKATHRDYVESINIIASVAREYNRDFWLYIQTFGWTKGKRTPTEAEFRWQCYSALSFGCKCILCWTYAGCEKEFPSLVDVDGVPTSAWRDFRPVALELRRISDEFVKFRNIGAFNYNCSDATPYLKMSNPCEFPTIREIDCDDPLLIGCFERKQAAKNAPQTAFILTNMTEPGDRRGTSARLRLDGTKVVAWYRGVPERIEPDDGHFEFHLASGEGVFVTVEK